MATKTVRRTISMTPEMHDLLMQIVVKRERDVKEVDLIREAIREYLDEQADVVGSSSHFQKSLRALGSTRKRLHIPPVNFDLSALSGTRG